MSKYFTYYPTIQYKDKQIRDISRRNKVRDDILQDPFIFLPYTIKEGEKPETIAELYYGSVDDTWLVLLANNLTDPYNEWPLDDEEFNKYFIDKYSEYSGKVGFDVIRWGQNQTIEDNIVYYYKEVNEETDSPTELYARGSTTLIDISDEQLQQILDDQVVLINGVQYRLVKE
jgi:hypothetical protein